MKQDITPKNNKDQRHDFWISYYSDGNLSYKGQYINGNYYGYWISNSRIFKSQINFYIK